MDKTDDGLASTTGREARFAHLVGTVLALSEAVFALTQSHADPELVQTLMDEYGAAASKGLEAVTDAFPRRANDVQKMWDGYHQTRQLLLLPPEW